MAHVAVHENHLTYGGVCYFRGHAEEVELGSIGEKRTPLTKQNYLEVKDHLPVAKLKGVKSTIVEIDDSSLSQSELGAKVSAIVPVSGVPETRWVDRDDNEIHRLVLLADQLLEAMRR